MYKELQNSANHTLTLSHFLSFISRKLFIKKIALDGLTDILASVQYLKMFESNYNVKMHSASTVFSVCT